MLFFLLEGISHLRRGKKESKDARDKKIKHCFFVHSSAVGFFFTLYMSESNRDKKLVVFSSSVTERGATEEGKKEKLPKEALPPKNILESLFFQARANGFCRCLGTRQGSALTCVCTVTSCVGGGVRSQATQLTENNHRCRPLFEKAKRRRRRRGGGVVFSHGGKRGR